ncbi:diguanylate cyclase [Mesorhizobium sp. 1M-11]|uniref:diguanylate cyclase domain-containing protein n=1 Tax=Mesorhizobium sp. 1M-11 TaxID=1529006 RepID=UPI000A62F46D|nr:diguanylate cyclase [Mesorhizobium sp. 1M-11]
MTFHHYEGRGPGKYLSAIALGLGFWLAAVASIQLSRVGDGVAALWLASAVAFVMLARRRHAAGWIDYTAIALATLASNLAFGSSWQMGVLFVIINVGYVALSLWLVDRFAGGVPVKTMPSARTFSLILFLTAVVADAIAGFVFAGATYALYGWPIVQTAWTFLSGNALGYALLLPFLTYATRSEVSALLKPKALFRFALVTVICVGLAYLALSQSRFPFALAMLPLMVIAPRLAHLELALVCAFVGAVCVAAAMGGFMPGLNGGTEMLSDGFQVSVAIIVSTPFLVGLFIKQISEDHARLADAETRWNFALASAGQGVWDADMRNNTVHYSATWKHMLGYEDHELGNDPDLWLELAHPDDVARMVAADHDHMEGRTLEYELEFRMRHKSGRWIWMADHGKAIEREPDGRVARAIGSMTDITKRKEAEERLMVSAALLADEKERLRVMLQSIGDAVIGTDAENRVTFMNPVAEKLTGATSIASLGKPLGFVYRAVDEETGRRLDEPHLADNRLDRTEQNSRAVLARNDGTRFSIRQVVSPILNEQNEFSGSVIVFQDFTDARTLQRQLAYAATHDALTGLANRPAFIRTVEDLLDKARQDASRYQLMFIDLDHFKPVNDTSGHAAGDALLRQVASTIKAVLTPSDIVARFGGDEFSVVLMSPSLADGERAVLAILDAVSALEFTWDGQTHHVSSSIGLTSIAADSGEVNEIIARADAACYAAKAAGRNCAFVALPGTAPGVATPMTRVATGT